MKRRTPRLTLRELGIAAFLALVIVWLCFRVVAIFHKQQLARLTVGETRAELAALDARSTSLGKTVNTLDTDRGREESLRETFGVVKPGEEVIVVVPKKDVPPPPPPTLWQKVKDFFSF